MKLSELLDSANARMPIPGTRVSDAYSPQKLDKFYEAGIRFAVKPTFWSDFDDPAFAEKYSFDEQKIYDAASSAHISMKTFRGDDVYETNDRPRSPLAEVKHKLPKQKIFMIEFEGNDKWLVETIGGAAFIKSWARVI